MLSINLEYWRLFFFVWYTTRNVIKWLLFWFLATFFELHWFDFKFGKWLESWRCHKLIHFVDHCFANRIQRNYIGRIGLLSKQIQDIRHESNIIIINEESILNPIKFAWGYKFGLSTADANMRQWQAWKIITRAHFEAFILFRSLIDVSIRGMVNKHLTEKRALRRNFH